MRIPLICVMVFTNLSLARAGTNGVLSLSHYDEAQPDYSALRHEGVEGIIHEATYPTEFDARYAGRQASASSAGMLWGAYHFGNATDGRKQADRFLDFVGTNANQSGALLILDAEQNTHYPGGTMQVTQAVDFVRRVRQRTGIYPGLYSNENWVKHLFNSPSIDAASKETIQNCWLWIANYHYQPVATAPWRNWMLWQYTGDGICALPRTNYPVNAANLHKVERTIFGGSRGEMHAFWSAHAWSPKAN